MFTAGVAPTPQYVSFRKCTAVYVLSQNTTECVVDLLNGVTGDPRYYVVSSVRGGLVTAPVYGMDPILNSPIMTFSYTAPIAAKRVDDFVSVIIAGAGCVNSPFRIVVYPAAAAVTTTDVNALLPSIVAIGLLFYGSTIGTGAYLMIRRQNRRNRVAMAKVEIAEQEEMEAAEEQYRREQIALHVQQQQQQQQQHEVVAMEDLALPPSDTEKE